MGCSPSKGQLFTGVTGPPRALPSASEDHLHLKPGEEERHCLGTNEGANDLPLPAKEEPPMPAEAPDVAPGSAIVSTSRGNSEIEVNLKSEGMDIQPESLAMGMQMKKVEKKRKIKGPKQGRRREKERSSIVHTKVDIPVHMVKAHQAAYAYLNPNISKYETLLGLLDQATQTQLSLQPMMTAIVMRFEEVNQALEEMADEGEQMLTEHGDHMAWPSGKRALHPVPTKPTANPSDPPPDLLQQMLQHSTEKMRLVGSSVHGLGDTALEEAVEYFDSLSKLLGERLQAKRAAEGRLTQVLARVEAAARRKSSPEDSALHSEDSGIGGENESLPGSDRHRHHRGSSGSGGNTRSTPQCPTNECEEEEEEDDDEEDEEEEEDEVERSGRKRSNSSPPDPSQPFLPSPPLQGLNQLPRRPLTAAPSARPARLQRLQSTECVHALLELQKSQRDLDQRMKKMADRAEGGANYALHRAGLRSHSSGPAVRHALKGNLKGNQSSNQLPAVVPHPPGRNSVRRLINTFSNGVDGRPGQSLANIPPNIRGPRKSGTPFLPNIGMGEQSLINNDNNNNNSWPVEAREDVDVDSLPPPPLEVLMDNSFQSTEENTGEDEGPEEEKKAGHRARQRSSASQRLRASMQHVTVLPNRSTVRRSSLSMSPARPVRQDAVAGSQGPELLPNKEQDPGKEQAASLYRQARKIIHLRNAAESPVRAAERGLRGPPPLRAGGRQGSDDYCEVEAYYSPLPPTTPPVSRVRLPPSCPSVHYRIPSPPVNKNQPTSSSQPSRPTSPRVLTWARDTSCEENSSMSFYDARSVFSQNRQTSSDTSTLPRTWEESSRGRMPTRGSQTARRTQSDRRPSLTEGTGSCHSNKTNPTAYNRMNAITATEGDNQSDTKGISPTALNTEQSMAVQNMQWELEDGEGA
ncbi:photoreceptor cilium actin regulator [Hypomesus transpacificus]|uniref:photoreceptor cilium actin regulator n=1 Tax=Hypomesus transpacificus TaxID=137520 RepID=UPI001F073055|nr:photoreceptor cilium actin regulator [Hypomesus transpacificus]